MVESPCIKVCKLEDDVCVGCLRTKEEIGRWASMTDDEKLEVALRILRELQEEVENEQD